MSDVTEAPTQDAIAESLLPESEQQTVEQPETEQQVEEQVQEQPQEQQEEQTQEIAEDWLPTEQDKVFPDEVYARYGQRYNFTPEQAQDPLVRQLLHDKINADIFIQQQQLAQEQQEALEPEPQAEPTREQAQLTPEQHFAQLDRYAQERTSPEAAKWFHGQFLRAFGVPDAEIAKVSPEQAVRFGQVATAGIANIANTIIDDLLQARIAPLISQVFPGFSEMYNRSAHALAWDRVRNSSPQYATLPAYGTKEFSAKLREASQRVPEVAEMIDEADGKPMNATQVARWYGLLARIASGQNVNPQLLQQAAAAGARNARRAEVRRSAGNLGSGQSKAASGQQQRSSTKFQTNDDLFDDATMEIYQREHGRL
jgi:HD-GYP domain-containing protein (c-di-GMP phosphodiesterase class II)